VRAAVGADVEYASHASVQRTGTVTGSRFADLRGGFAFLAAPYDYGGLYHRSKPNIEGTVSVAL
jgi:hypothetical protein